MEISTAAAVACTVVNKLCFVRISVQNVASGRKHITVGVRDTSSCEVGVIVLTVMISITVRHYNCEKITQK